MRVLKLAVLAAVVVWPVSTSHASVLGGLLTFNGEADQLIATASRVNVLDQDGSGGFSDADVIYGYIEVNSIVNEAFTTPDGVDVTPNSLAIAFAAEIESTSGTLFSLGVVDSVGNSGLDLASLLGPVAGAVASTDIFAVLGSTSISPPATTSFFETATPALSAGGLVASGGTPDALANFGGGFTVELTGGLTGLGDFFTFFGTSPFTGFQTGGFSVTSSPGFDPSTVFLDVPTSTSTPPFLPTGDTSSVALELTTVAPNLTGVGTDGFGFTANAVFTVNVIPEPVSFLVWGGLAATIGSSRNRRRRV